MDGAREGGSKGGRGTVCVVAWLRRRRGGRRMERRRKKTGQGHSRRESRDRWGCIDSTRRKQVRRGPRSQPFHSTHTKLICEIIILASNTNAHPHLHACVHTACSPTPPSHSRHHLYSSVQCVRVCVWVGVWLGVGLCCCE